LVTTILGQPGRGTTVRQVETTEGVRAMLGPTQPEMGRLKTSDGIRRSENHIRAASLARAQGAERRGRMIGGAFQAMIAVFRSKPVKAPEPVRPATVPTP
jgi:hypothetical protein